MKKQVKDFNSASVLNGSTDYFLMQRVTQDGLATTLKVQLNLLKNSLLTLEDSDSGGGTTTPSLVFSPLVKIIGKNGPVTGITPLVNSQLYITDVGEAVGIDLVSAVHRTSRINFRHGDTDFAANIYTCGTAFTPVGASRKLYIDVGNTTAVNRLEIGEKFSVFYKDVYIVNGQLTFDSRLSGTDTLPGSNWAVLHLQNVSDHAIMDIMSSPSHTCGINLRHFNSNNECRMFFTGPNHSGSEEKNAFHIRNFALKPGTNELDYSNSSTFRLGRTTSWLSVPLRLDGYLFIMTDGLINGVPYYEGGQVSLGCSHESNVHKMSGCVDFLKFYDLSGAWGDLQGKTVAQSPHWTIRNYFQIQDYAGTPASINCISDGSFHFGFNKAVPHFTGSQDGLPKFIIQKLAGGGNVQADVYGNLSIASSDARLKTNISSLGFGLAEILQLRPVQFNWIENDMFSLPTNITDFGMIAQEVEKVFPNLVNENPVGFKTLDYTRFIPVLIKAVQELSNELIKLKAKVK